MSADRVSRRSFLARACGGSLVAACGTLGLPAVLAALPTTEITGRTEGLERAYPIPAADGVSIDRTEAIIIVRYQNEAFALGLTCPHENAAVKWIAVEGRFQCSRHDSRYTPQGAYISGRSTRNLDRFAIRRDGASLLVNLDKVIQADRDPAAWAAAKIAL
jgi:nitrite reductase/ring-hydroxylating ferredoxin subunit